MVPATWLVESPDGVVLRLYVQPKARCIEIGGIHNGRLRISVAEPPDRGRANAAVLRQIAEWLDLPRGQVVLLRGESSRQKDVRLEGRSLTDIAKILSRSLG